MATEGANVGLWDWNIETGEVHFNEQWYTLLGYKPYELLESFETFKSLCHPDDRQSVIDALDAHFENDKVPYKINLRMRHANGDWVWIHTTGKVMQRDGDGKPIRAYGIHIDVSEQVRAEQALKAANRKLEQFAFMASHDMKTPLRTIAMSMGLLKQQAPEVLSGENKQTFDFIMSAINELQLMLEDLLAFSRNESVSAQEETFNAQGAVEDVLRMMSSSIEEAKMEVTIDKLPTITSNRARFTRVLQNLISNALKFAKADVTPQVIVQCDVEQDCWTFSLKDNGIGIEEENLEFIFEPYARVNPQGGVEGLGLGLNIVQQFVSDLGGDVWVESEYGKGSAFFFSIPMPEASRP